MGAKPLLDHSSMALLLQASTQSDGFPWLAMSGEADPTVMQRARDEGARGFVQKQVRPEVFSQAFVALLTSQRWFEAKVATVATTLRPHEWAVTPTELGLTKRQGDILALVLHGLPNKRIALMLDLSESTVKEHLTGILRRLGVKTCVEILMRLRGQRLVLEPPQCA